MSSEAPVSVRESAAERIWVDDGERRRPFMRGIMVHSLLARGVDFETAYRTADQVHERLRGRDVVPKDELRRHVRELLGSEPFLEDHRLVPPEVIQVTGGSQRRPFSQGVLSQSLLAAALDPNEAFDVARQIERDLIARGVREIDREELRQKTYETLSRDVGERAAERYLVWRRYQHPDRPVILLLGGATGVGKTSLALEVARRLGIGRVLSTDSIRQIMRLMLSEELVPPLHASSYDAYRTLPPESLSDDPVIDGFRAQSTTVSVGVRALMERAIAENTSLVIDGVALVPGLIDPKAWADQADVFFLVVATLDEAAFRARFESRGAAAAQRPPHRYIENLPAILRIQEHYLDLAERYEVPIVDNVSLDRSVLFTIRHIVEGLRKRGLPGEALPA